MTTNQEHLALGKAEVIRALVQQVQNARGNASCDETAVRTIISRPMWRMWCVALGNDPNCDPTEWTGDFSCRRVYGSETIVVESDQLFAVSFLP